MLTWWTDLAPREQALVGGAVASLVLALLWFALFWDSATTKGTSVTEPAAPLEAPAESKPDAAPDRQDPPLSNDSKEKLRRILE